MAAPEKSEQQLVDQWRDLLAVHARTLCELDRVLQRLGLGASDVEVLDVLAAGTTADGDTGYRVQEIADRVHLSQSALSRLVGRLERDGLVERCVCLEDRRGVWVTLTPKGRALHAEALPLKRAVLGRMLARGSQG